MTDEALVRTDQGLNLGFCGRLSEAPDLFMENSMVREEDSSAALRTWRLTWPSEHPSFCRDFGTDKVMTHLQTRSLKPGRRANSQHTQSQEEL